MNAKKNLTALAVTALLTVPAFSVTNSTHIHIPKFSDSLMTTAHADSTVSLPSSYLGKWRANYDYGPESSGHKSVYAPYSVTLGHNQGSYYHSNDDKGTIVYTYGNDGGFTGYHYWRKNEPPAGGGNNFRLLPNGELEWHENTAMWHLHHVHHHAPNHHHHTPTPEPTPNPEPTPSPSPSNNNNNGGGAVTPTGSSTNSNNIYFGNNGYNANASSDSSNLSLGSVNSTNNTSNTANINNKLPQTNESTHTTAEAILGATALTASASLMALDFSKKHKYEAMEDTDAKHSSNSNDRSYNTIMRGTFADLSKSLKHL